MTCGSKKHIEEALAKIHVHDNDVDKEAEEVNARLGSKERNKKKKVTA